MWRANSPPVPGKSARSAPWAAITLRTHICGSTARAKTAARMISPTATSIAPQTDPWFHLLADCRQSWTGSWKAPCAGPALGRTGVRLAPGRAQRRRRVRPWLKKARACRGRAVCQQGQEVSQHPSRLDFRPRVRRRRPSAPHLAGDLDDHLEFGPLLLLGENVALLGGGKAALGRQAQLLERSEFRRLVEPPLDGVLLLQRAALGGDEPHRHALLALGQEAQRLEPARALGVVFQEVAIVGDAAE